MRSQPVSTKLQHIAEQAVQFPDRVFTTLMHLIDADFLGEAFRRTRKSGAPGIDKVTAQEYAANLEENLANLHERMRTGRYKAPPVKRVWIDKDDGRKRPIGIPVLEDKIVQRAVTMLLESVYEQEFLYFSYGFRPGRNQHQALHELREQCMNNPIRVILDVDVSGFFDNLDWGHLREFIKQRVNDGGILRFLGKWRHAGVLEEGILTVPDKGSPQGGVISPMLANIYLHHVLDLWYIREVKPRLKGYSFIIRFADDFIIGCELESDAQRLMEVLPKRFDRFGLSINQKKTKVIGFSKPHGPRKGPGLDTFEFLGFTHYWAQSRRGNWVIKRKTARKRLRRTMKRIWSWCDENRHMDIREQYQKLCQKLRGHYQYYGIRSNYAHLKVVYNLVDEAWRFWLSRRSHKGKVTWDKYDELKSIFPLPLPRIVHSI